MVLELVGYRKSDVRASLRNVLQATGNTAWLKCWLENLGKNAMRVVALDDMYSKLQKARLRKHPRVPIVWIHMVQAHIIIFQCYMLTQATTKNTNAFFLDATLQQLVSPASLYCVFPQPDPREVTHMGTLSQQTLRRLSRLANVGCDAQWVLSVNVVYRVLERTALGDENVDTFMRFMNMAITSWLCMKTQILWTCPPFHTPAKHTLSLLFELCRGVVADVDQDAAKRPVVDQSTCAITDAPYGFVRSQDRPDSGTRAVAARAMEPRPFLQGPGPENPGPWGFAWTGSRTAPGYRPHSNGAFYEDGHVCVGKITCRTLQISPSATTRGRVWLFRLYVLDVNPSVQGRNHTTARTLCWLTHLR